MDDLSITFLESTSAEQAVIRNVSKNAIHLGKYAVVIDFEDGTVVQIPTDSIESLLLKPSDEILLKTPGDSSCVSSEYIATIEMPRGFTLGDNPEIRLYPCVAESIFVPPEQPTVKSTPPNPRVTEPPPPPKRIEKETKRNSNLCEKCGEPLNAVRICTNRICT